MEFENDFSDIKVLSIEGSSKSASSKSLINHLAASTDASEDKMMKEVELEEETLDGIDGNVYEIEVDGVLYRRKHSEFENEATTRVDVEAWDFVLESVKTLEKENEALKSKLKSEEEKFVNETEEKVSMKRQLLLQQKEILKLKKEALYLPSKKKSVVQQFQISDKNSDNGGEDRTSNSFEMKDCDLESLNIIESDKFYGFSEEEAVIAISSVSKLLLDKLVVDEEAFIEALECELDETCKRSMFEKLIQDDELDSSREWLEVEGIFDDL